MTLTLERKDDGEVRQEIHAQNRDGGQEAWSPDENRESASSSPHAEEGAQRTQGHGDKRQADRSLVSFQWEAWPAIIGEAMPMLRLYWNSGGEIFGKELPMDPDLDYAMQLHNWGRLRILTARRGGLLIGVNSFNVGTTLIRKSIVTAIALILYLLPSERRGLVGYRFLRQTDNDLAAMGVRLVQYAPGSTVDISALLRRLRYKNQQGTWEKML